MSKDPDEGEIARRLAARHAAGSGRDLAAFVHELAAPLTLARLASDQAREALREDALDRRALDELIVEVREGLEHAARLMEDARALTVQAPRPAELTLLGDVAHAARRLTRWRAPPGVTASVAAAPAPVRGQRHRLIQVAVNLLSNAYDALARVGRPGAIRVGAGQAGGRCLLWVEDDGPGVPEALCAQLFEPFVTGAQGLGLGLWLSRAIVEEHGGTLRLEPTTLDAPPGQGARFVVSLPAASG